MSTKNLKKTVSEYYDDFASKQQKVWINIRHLTIYNNIKLLEEKTANFDKITQSIEKLHENWENILYLGIYSIIKPYF